eukprot:scaffold263436_cov37-Attheya_sp.AAC.1
MGGMTTCVNAEATVGRSTTRDLLLWYFYAVSTGAGADRLNREIHMAMFVTEYDLLSWYFYDVSNGAGAFCVLSLPTDFVYRLNAFAESTSIDSTQIQLDDIK